MKTPAPQRAQRLTSMAFEARRALLMGSPEKCGSASASVRQALAEAASSGSTTLTTFCASAACVNHRQPGGAPLINCKHSRFSTLLYFIADKRICQTCHEHVVQLQQEESTEPELAWASRAERASLLGMDYFLAHILPLLPQGLFQQTARVLVDKTLTYISEGLPQDKRAEPWRSLHLIEGYDAAGALRGLVDALNLARCGTPLREVLTIVGRNDAKQRAPPSLVPQGMWRARPGLQSWLLRLRHDADVVAAADAYYQNWQIWLAEEHGSHAVASSGIAPRRRLKLPQTPPAPGHRVVLQVYELGSGTRLADTIRSLNSFTQTALGAGGVFHVAVEVEGISSGLEWSFGYAPHGSGVFALDAKRHPDHAFRETVPMGETHISRADFGRLIREMQGTWAGDKYQLLRCNCISFCNELCIALGVGPVPAWVDRFPRLGAGGQDFAEKVSAVASAASGAVTAARDAVIRPAGKPPLPLSPPRASKEPPHDPNGSPRSPRSPDGNEPSPSPYTLYPLP